MPEPKGTVYGGIVRFAAHPSANMHGELRCIIRTRMFSQVIEAMARYGIELYPRDLGRTWAESQSHIEQAATMPRYGEVLACPIALAYLQISHYTPVPATLIVPRSK